MDFLGGSDFLFSFFEELRSEEKTIDDIRGEDLYAAFEDNLEVLEELFAAYKDELSKVGAYDFISMERWDVNDEYLQNFEEVRVDEGWRIAETAHHRHRSRRRRGPPLDARATARVHEGWPRKRGLCRQATRRMQRVCGWRAVAQRG